LFQWCFYFRPILPSLGENLIALARGHSCDSIILSCPMAPPWYSLSPGGTNTCNQTFIFDIQSTTVVILFIIKLYTLIFLKRKCDIIIKSTIILKYWALIYDRSKGVSGFIVVLFLFNCWKISFILICFSKSDNMNLLIQLLNLVWKENQSVHFNSQRWFWLENEITETIYTPFKKGHFGAVLTVYYNFHLFFSQKKIAEISKITEKNIIPDIMIRTQMFRSSHHKASNFWVQVSYYNIIKSKHWTLGK
jgi:hypothetical protein